MSTEYRQALKRYLRDLSDSNCSMELKDIGMRAMGRLFLLSFFGRRYYPIWFGSNSYWLFVFWIEHWREVQLWRLIWTHLRKSILSKKLVANKWFHGSTKIEDFENKKSILQTGVPLAERTFIPQKGSFYLIKKLRSPILAQYSISKPK